ncbi:MAG: replication-associated recombination protein A [Gammaproteobacteria bacterium]|nr:replication-associated recombination protein A [Gammaproteobacteria bacterium]
MPPELFETSEIDSLEATAPLATRMRPRVLDEFVGQSHLLGAGGVLASMLAANRLHSMILFGPPGCGKTTLARLIAREVDARFVELSAVTSGVRDLRREADEAKRLLHARRIETLLFVDEIHRFSKSQQDALLPHVESGVFHLIGATTENPSFEVISPLLSRARVYTFKPLADEDMDAIIDAALACPERGLGKMDLALDDDARGFLKRAANGDARAALNALEIAAESASDNRVSSALLEAALEKRARYDRLGDAHYDTISAFIKSIRASDPDAALYYLARMLDAGEDVQFIARRLVISAAEDIGLASPNALTLAVAAQQAAHFVGMPEARIPLAEATIYLASAPKSNSAYLAIDAALDVVRKGPDEPVPLHLRNAPTKLMKSLGHGEGYVYPHDAPGHFVASENLPEKLRDKRFYFPGELGLEEGMGARLKTWWGTRYVQHEGGE